MAKAEGTQKMAFPEITIGGVQLIPNKHTGRYPKASLSNDQMKAILSELKPVFEAWDAQAISERPDNAFSDNDSLDGELMELMEWCEGYIDFDSSMKNYKNPHYEWMDMMRGFKPGKY